MIEQIANCKNCLYFIDMSTVEPYGAVDRKYACHLHGSEARITEPLTQFCGSEHWVSIKLKTRMDNLEELLNTD